MWIVDIGIQEREPWRAEKLQTPLNAVLCKEGCGSSPSGKGIEETEDTRKKIDFQRGLSATMNLIDLDAVVRDGSNRIDTIDLAKAYDRFNRRILLGDCKKVLETELTDMPTACLRVLTVKTKEDVMGNEAKISLGLTQGAPLSPMLFLVYINDLPACCRRRMEK